MKYTPYFTEEQYTAYEQQKITITRPLIDYSMELALKPGFLVYSTSMLFSSYGIAVAKYENGDYAALRSIVDGIQDTYNMVDNALSFGFGVGTDIQTGKLKEFDIGVNLEYCSMFNKTQSVPYSFVENNITGRPSLGGELHRYSSYKYGVYADYKNIKVSIMITDNEAASFQIYYKF